MSIGNIRKNRQIIVGRPRVARLIISITVIELLLCCTLLQQTFAVIVIANCMYKLGQFLCRQIHSYFWQCKLPPNSKLTASVKKMNRDNMKVKSLYIADFMSLYFDGNNSPVLYFFLLVVTLPCSKLYPRSLVLKFQWEPMLSLLALL